MMFWMFPHRNADVGGTGSSAGTFSRRATEAALMDLVTRYSGVHHQLVLDVPQAAAVIVGLTKALAQQPYQSRVCLCPCILQAFVFTASNYSAYIMATTERWDIAYGMAVMPRGSVLVHCAPQASAVHRP